MDPIKSHDPFKEGRWIRDIQQKREGEEIWGKRVSRRDLKHENLTCHCGLNMEEGGHEPKNLAACKSWEWPQPTANSQQGNGGLTPTLMWNRIPPRSKWTWKRIYLQNLQKGSQPCWHLNFGCVNPRAENQLGQAVPGLLVYWTIR